jgi:hypothetical protein
MQFFGFLHLQDGENSAVNLKARSFRHRVVTYVKNADLLSQSLRAHGHEFTLLTNRADLIRQFAPAISDSLAITTIDFTTRVPSGVRFYSGHFKLDAFRYLSQLPYGYVAHIDLDMVCFNDAPLALREAEESGQALYYDITNQVVPSAGEEPLRRQLEEILGRPVTLDWSGGEFLAGPPKFFAALTEAVESIFERYLDVSVGRYRVGNEPYQNAAIEILREKGWDIRDAGEMRIVGRYWNMPVKHAQPAFSAFDDIFLLHLPVDKHVLSLIHALHPSQASSFLSLYRSLKWLWLPLEVFQRLRGKVGAISIRR